MIVIPIALEATHFSISFMSVYKGLLNLDNYLKPYIVDIYIFIITTYLKGHLLGHIIFKKIFSMSLFDFLFLILFIFGCIGSSLLHAGFL